MAEDPTRSRRSEECARHAAEAGTGDRTLRADPVRNGKEAVRLALREAAERRRRKSALRLEALAAAADPDDRAEARRVREEMDAIAAAWTDAG
jgi:hypothetical protein